MMSNKTMEENTKRRILIHQSFVKKEDKIKEEEKNTNMDNEDKIKEEEKNTNMDNEDKNQNDSKSSRNGKK